MLRKSIVALHDNIDRGYAVKPARGARSQLVFARLAEEFWPPPAALG